MSWTHYHPVACGRVHSVRTVLGNDDDDGTAIGGFQFVGVGKGVRAEIDREPVPVGVADACAVACGQRAVADNRLVGIRPAALAAVRLHQLGHGAGIDDVAVAGEVSGLVVPPKLARRKRCDGSGEFTPACAPFAGRYATPMPRERTNLGVAETVP